MTTEGIGTMTVRTETALVDMHPLILTLILGLTLVPGVGPVPHREGIDLVVAVLVAIPAVDRMEGMGVIVNMECTLCTLGIYPLSSPRISCNPFSNHSERSEPATFCRKQPISGTDLSILRLLKMPREHWSR